jgi:hypothetical protein
LLGNGGVLFVVRSGAVDWQRQQAGAVFFWSILRMVLSNDNNQVVFFMVRSFIYPFVQRVIE